MRRAAWRVSGGEYLGSAERCHGDRAPGEGNLREEGFIWAHGFRGAIRVPWWGRQGFWETLRWELVTISSHLGRSRSRESRLVSKWK